MNTAVVREAAHGKVHLIGNVFLASQNNPSNKLLLNLLLQNAAKTKQKGSINQKWGINVSGLFFLAHTKQFCPIDAVS